MNLVDPFLRGNSGSSVREIVRCIHMALLCVQENVGDRPTMSTILLMLSSSSLSLPLPSAPPFFMHSTINPEAPLLLNETTYSSQNEAWAQWREGTALNLVDPILRGNSSSGSVQEMMKCIHMALLCVQENVGDRPTMSTVVLMLSGSSLSLPLPSAPPFFMHSSITPDVSPQLPEQNSTMLQSLNETSIADAFFP
nr:putative receptor-like protein kinase At4g00960 [Ipomoea batatas]